MESGLRWALVTAVAPVAWGASYLVTQQWLPPEYPLWAAVIRALPGGLILLAVAHRMPSGPWWWRSLVLGTLNIGAFFVLVYVAAQLLPSSIAATLMALAPVVMLLLAWPMLHTRPRALPLAGAALGFVGVCAMLLTGGGDVSLPGVAASVGAMTMSSVGFILSKRWAGGAPVLPLTAWQLVAGGLVIVPVAAIVEGTPPTLSGTELVAFGYLTLVSTALAYLCWFTGLKHLDAGAVGLVGLLNPVTGVVLGLAVASETLSLLQGAGIGLVLLGIVLGQPVVARAAERRRCRRQGLGDDAAEITLRVGTR